MVRSTAIPSSLFTHHLSRIRALVPIIPCLIYRWRRRRVSEVTPSTTLAVSAKKERAGRTSKQSGESVLAKLASSRKMITPKWRPLVTTRNESREMDKRNILGRRCACEINLGLISMSDHEIITGNKSRDLQGKSPVNFPRR